MKLCLLVILALVGLSTQDVYVPFVPYDGTTFVPLDARNIQFSFTKPAKLFPSFSLPTFKFPILNDFWQSKVKPIFSPGSGAASPNSDTITQTHAPGAQVQADAPVAQSDAPVAQSDGPVAQSDAPVAQSDAPVAQESVTEAVNSVSVEPAPATVV